MKGSKNGLFYLTYFNTEEFLSLNIPNLNAGLKIFVIRCTLGHLCYSHH